MKKDYPFWVEKHHTKGTSIKQIGDNYYLYSVTSIYSKEKGYPVSKQKYIGTITREGLIKPQKVSFTPGMDKIVLFKDLFDLSAYSANDHKLIADIPIVIVDDTYYSGSLTKLQIKVINKHFFYSEGIIHS